MLFITPCVPHLSDGESYYGPAIRAVERSGRPETVWARLGTLFAEQGRLQNTMPKVLVPGLPLTSWGP